MSFSETHLFEQIMIHIGFFYKRDWKAMLLAMFRTIPSHYALECNKELRGHEITYLSEKRIPRQATGMRIRVSVGSYVEHYETEVAELYRCIIKNVEIGSTILLCDEWYEGSERVFLIYVDTPVRIESRNHQGLPPDL